MTEMLHPVWPNDAFAASAAHARDIRRLKHRSCGPWVNVGDPGAPPFTNGANAGGGLTPMRFRVLLGGGIEIQGSVTGVALGDVIFTLPAGYRPDSELRLAASDDTGAFVAFRILASGDVIYGVT